MGARGRERVDCVGGEVGAEVEGLGVVLVGCRRVCGRGTGNEYRIRTKISAKGFPVRKRCGFNSNSLALFFRLSPSVFLPLAFSMIPLSMIVIIGATSAPAAPAASASLPRRRPSLSVFHFAGAVVTAADEVIVDDLGSACFTMTGSSPKATALLPGFCSSPIAASCCDGRTGSFGAACNEAKRSGC